MKKNSVKTFSNKNYTMINQIISNQISFQKKSMKITQNVFLILKSEMKII